MSVRLKLLLAVLAAGVGLTFWYVTGSSWTGTDNSVAARASSASLEKALCGDTDADGLCDYDETYWDADFMNPDTDGDGFKDGEEVLTGHDPAKAGPDDYLDEKRNLTQRYSALLLGAVTSGTLDKSNPGYNRAIDELVEELFAQYDTNVAVELDAIQISSDSEADLLAYGITINNIQDQIFAEIEANFENLLETAKDVPASDMAKMKALYPVAFKAFTTAADAESSAFNQRASTIKSVRVPPSMQKYHRSLLLYLRGMQQRYVTLKTIDQDPLAALISLQVIRTLALATPLDLMDSFRQSYANAIIQIQ